MQKDLFPTNKGQLTPATNAINLAGGTAYAFPEKHALAQYASTGCLGSTFYAERKDILNVGGFSDVVFNLLTDFVDDKLSSEHWTGEIEKVEC